VILQRYMLSASHGISGVFFRQFRIPFDSNLSKSVFNVGSQVIKGKDKDQRPNIN
jgi:hypothetical protein